MLKCGAISKNSKQEHFMKFTKMQGCGNDYVYMDTFSEKVEDRSAMAQLLSNRNFGIGSDGLIFINPSDKADFEMEMYNLDGSRAQMCGNGIRCVGKYVYEHGLTDKTDFIVDTLAGLKHLHLNISEGEVSLVSVDMGGATIIPEQIPVKPDEFEDYADGVGAQIEVLGEKYKVTPVSMCNPHSVCFIDQDVEDFDLMRIGPAFETHPAFPEKVNAEFVNIRDRSHIKVRVWERGSGETCACGTGACACVVAGVLNGLLDKEVFVEMKGGVLRVTWDEVENRVTLAGPAVTVFEGETRNIQKPYKFAE